MIKFYEKKNIQTLTYSVWQGEKGETIKQNTKSVKFITNNISLHKKMHEQWITFPGFNARMFYLNFHKDAVTTVMYQIREMSNKKNKCSYLEALARSRTLDLSFVRKKLCNSQNLNMPCKFNNLN